MLSTHSPCKHLCRVVSCLSTWLIRGYTGPGAWKSITSASGMPLLGERALIWMSTQVNKPDVKNQIATQTCLNDGLGSFLMVFEMVADFIVQTFPCCPLEGHLFNRHDYSCAWVFENRYLSCTSIPHLTTQTFLQRSDRTRFASPLWMWQCWWALVYVLLHDGHAKFVLKTFLN